MTAATEERPEWEIGLLGLGRWGSVWARVLADMGVLSWAVDPDPEARDRLSHSYPGVDAHEEIPEWELEYTHGVVVATPPETHADVALPLLRLRMPLLVEKPMATCEVDARAMAVASEENNVPLMVGHTFRHSLPVQRAFEWANERLGEIRMVSLRWLQQGARSGTGDVLWNLGPHPLSVALPLVPDAAPTVFSVTARDVDVPGLCDWTYFHVLWEDGFVLTCELSHVSPEKEREFLIVGEEGSVLCRPTQGEVLWKSRGGGSERADVTERSLEAGPEPLQAEAQEFLDAIYYWKERRGYDGCWMVTLLEAVSKRLGRELRGSPILPPATTRERREEP